MKKLILSLSLLACFNAIAETESVWQDFTTSAKNRSIGLNDNQLLKKRSLLLDESLLKSRLSLNSNKKIAARATNISKQISLPLPDGSLIKVSAASTQVITPEMAEAHPELKTWKVTGVDDPRIKGVIDFTTNGFHGMLMMPDGDVIFIDPDKDQAGDTYQSFSKKQNTKAFDNPLNCMVHDHSRNSYEVTDADFAIKPEARSLTDAKFPNVAITNVKTYRLALSATAEYTANRGGTAAARSSMVTSINRINPIFERDLGISLQLIDAPDLIFSNAATDPFRSPNNPNSLMLENGNYLSAQNRLGEFDIGHVLSHKTVGFGGSGVAFVGVACLNQANGGTLKGAKAAGATISSNPTGETFDLVLLAHELGHQLGANHSFNSSQGANCSGGRTGEVAVEPGSGSSIMSYNGLCGGDDLPEAQRDDYFHFASISQIVEYTRNDIGGSCGTNKRALSVPTANAGADSRIPANTPFILDGTASAGSASWDQIDIGSASAVNVDNGGNAIIRHIIPSAKQDRYIPRLSDLFTGSSTVGEIMPTTTRELNFAYVVRNGGVASDKKLINVTNTQSVFSVVSQDTAQSLKTNQNLKVIWNPASTNTAPINCSNVDIQLIRQSGVKNMLLASTANDGSQSLVIPNATPTMSGARIFVGCSDNSFFNISKGSISIQKGSAAADTIAPQITVLGTNPITITKGESYVDAGATAVDNVDGAITVSTTGSVNTNVVGNYSIRYTATDAAGNSNTATRTVKVQAASVVDTIPPVISVNGNSNIQITQGTAYVDAGASATDNIDGNLTVITIGSVNTNVVGSYTLRYSATDAAGNTANAIRSVNIIAPPSPTPDTSAPVITLIGANPVSVEKGSSYTEFGATAFDAIDGNVTVVITGTVNTNAINSYTVTYTATDNAGNSANITRSVVVTNKADTTPPIITLTGDAEITLAIGEEYIDPGVTANDDRDGVTTVKIEGLDKVDTSKAGEYVITYTSVDAAGNTIVEKRTVVITNNGQNPGNDLASDPNSNSGGGSVDYWLISLLTLLGLRRPKPVKVPARKSK